jgi:predicted nucleic acid-binding protein
VQRVLFDTSVYIKSLREKDDSLIRTRSVAPGTTLWLSSVVLEELYAGARKGATKVVDKLDRDFRTLVKDSNVAVGVLQTRQTGGHTPLHPYYKLLDVESSLRG